MKAKIVLLLPLILLLVGCIQELFNTCGGVQGIPCPEGYECDTGNVTVTDAFGKCVPISDSKPGVCELGKQYEESATKKVDCVCPEGYEFKTEIIGYSHEGDVESPIMGLKCKPKE